MLAQLAVESKRTLTGEFVHRFVLQIRSASAAVEARDVDTTEQFDRAVFATKISRTKTLVIGHSVQTGGSVLTRLVTAAFVDFQLAVVPFVAGQTLTGVIVDAVQAGTEFARRLAAGRSGCC